MDRNAADKDMTTPLLFAAWNGHTKVVQALLAAVVDKAAASKDGTTPLHIAALNGQRQEGESAGRSTRSRSHLSRKRRHRAVATGRLAAAGRRRS